MEITVFTVIVIFIGLCVQEFVRWHKGLAGNSFYPAHSTRTERVEIAKGIPIYRQGLKHYAEELDAEAVACWKEAERHGVLRAMTCLGVDAYERNHPSLARTYWHRAAEGGEMASKIILKVMDSRGEAPGIEIYRCFILAELDGDWDARVLLIGAALAYGFKDYAKDLRNQVRSDENRSSRSRFQY